MAYIDNLLHYYSTTQAYNENKNSGLINPDSICFVGDSGVIYAQNDPFGIDKRAYDALQKAFTILHTNVGDGTTVVKTDSSGLIPSSYLPSYVDDVLEYDSLTRFPSPGESGKIYVDRHTNLTYRWSGSEYVEISKSLALGTTASTAFPGDKGQEVSLNLNSHTLNQFNPHNVTKAQVGLGKVDNTSDLEKPISNPTKEYVDNAVKGSSNVDVLDVKLVNEAGRRVTVDQEEFATFIIDYVKNPVNKKVKISVTADDGSTGTIVSQAMTCSMRIDDDITIYQLLIHITDFDELADDLNNAVKKGDVIKITVGYNTMEGRVTSFKASIENMSNWFKA